jgi:hypothetical protein
MDSLTPQASKTVEELAQRHGVSSDAVTTLLHALKSGNGTMAQFSHPELGGMGQWSQGGMIMIGDMFNNALKAKVDALCTELSNLLRRDSSLMPQEGRSSSQYQRQGPESGPDDVSLFIPARGATSGNWWGSDLGAPSATGSQNEIRYAYFPGGRRLAIRIGDHVTIYDTGDHRIGGVSQQQSGDASLTFVSQHGLVRVADLPVVSGLTV